MPELTKERLTQTREDAGMLWHQFERSPGASQGHPRGIPAERQAVLRGVLVSKVQHYTAASQKSGGRVHEDFPTYKKKLLNMQCVLCYIYNQTVKNNIILITLR